MCYGNTSRQRYQSNFNLDHQAWAGPKPPPEDDVRQQPNLRRLHPGNDWANLSVQKHAGADGQRKPSKRPNLHLYDTSEEMPPFLSSSVASRPPPATAPRPASAEPRRKASVAARLSMDNPFAATAGGSSTAGGRKKPTAHKMRTPYAELKLAHQNDFNGKRGGTIHRQKTNRFYNSTGGWGAAQGVSGR